MTRRALVTGITGFIGSALAVRLLADGWAVDAIVRPHSETESLPFAQRVRFHRVADGASLTPTLADARPDVVFHLASLYLAEHAPGQVEDLVRSNILFPALLAEAMTSTEAKCLINTGTAWQQFRSEAYNPVNLYAATKQAAEDLLHYFHDARSLSVVTLRLFDTYGKGDKRRKLMQILIDAAITGEALAMSPGEQVVDLTHVDDVVSGFVVAAERLMATDTALFETYLLSGERLTVKGLADVVASGMGRAIRAQFGGRPYRQREVMMPVGDDGKALPGWTTRYDLRRYIAENRV
jgi:nucleoside-diphosphate-sugar epimerase